MTQTELVLENSSRLPRELRDLTVSIKTEARYHAL
jgi:hypothetical protein